MSVIAKEKKTEVKNTELFYELIESICKTDGCNNETVFGIRVTQTNGAQTKTCLIEDICANRMKVEHLLTKIRLAELNPDYLYDIVEDFLEEEYGNFVKKDIT